MCAYDGGGNVSYKLHETFPPPQVVTQLHNELLHYTLHNEFTVTLVWVVLLNTFCNLILQKYTNMFMYSIYHCLG